MRGFRERVQAVWVSLTPTRTWIPRLLVWGICVGMLAAANTSCNRTDPTPTATDARSQQQMDLMQRQLEALANELRVAGGSQGSAIGAGSTSSSTAAELRELFTRLAVLENRAVRDTDVLTLRSEVQQAAATMESLQSALTDQARLAEGVATLRMQVERLDAHVASYATQRSADHASIEDLVARLRTLESGLANQLASYLASLQTPGGAADPRTVERLTTLEAELQAAQADQSRLRAQLEDRQRELDRSARANQALIARIERMEARLAELGLDPAEIQREPTAGTGAGATTGRPDPTPSPTPATGGSPGAVAGSAINGRVAMTREGATSAIVVFPTGTPRTLQQRFNVFDENGVKLATFTVLTDSTPREVEGREVWLGGSLEPLPGRRPCRRDDRVSNLPALPALPSAATE